MLPRIPSIASLALPAQSQHAQPMTTATTAIFTVAPECTASSVLHPRSVPVFQWDAAKRKYFQAGGLTGADAIAEFLIGLTNADMLPQTIRGWLEDLCEIEGAALLRVLEEHHRMSGTGGMTAKKSSVSSRKFSLLGRQTHPTAATVGGDGKATPRATSFRMTPRRLSMGTTPADEPLSVGHGSSVALSGGSSAENALTACLRLRFDWNNVRLLEDVITNVLPLRSVIDKGSSSPTLAALNSLSASKPTYDYQRNTGTLTTEQLALLLDHVSEGTTLPRGVVPGGSFASRKEMEAREGLENLLRGEDTAGTTTAAGSSQARRKLDALLEEMGLSLPPVASHHASAADALSLLGANTLYTASDAVSSATGVPSVVLEIEELFRSSEGWDADEETDVLKRLTPRRAETSLSSKPPHGSGISGPAASRRAGAPSSHHRRPNAEPMLPPIATRSSPTIERIHGMPTSQLGAAVAAHMTTPGQLSQRSAVVDSSAVSADGCSSFRTIDDVARYDSMYSACDSSRGVVTIDAPAQPSKLLRAATATDSEAAPVALTAKTANAHESPTRTIAPPTATASTQTDVPSFTRLWLGPRRRNAGTSTRASGTVGKVVSVALLRASRARQQLAAAKGETALRHETFDELRRLGVEELSRRYAASVAAGRRRSPTGDAKLPQQKSR